MQASAIEDFSRLCVHTITTKPWNLEQAMDHFAKAGVTGISIWRDTLEGWNLTQVPTALNDRGLNLVSLVRGGFFPAGSHLQKQASIDENIKAIEEAATIGAPLLVLVCGAWPGQDLEVSRKQIQEGIEAILPVAEGLGVSLGIEPLHPMYADTRSAINTLKQANDLAESIHSDYLGVVLDVYHLWWDPDLEQEIYRCGQNGNLLAYHVCDWKVPTQDMLNDRGLMGEGCIPLHQIRSWVEKAGFNGFIEVEIFSESYWVQDQQQFLEKIKEAYLKYV